VRILRRVNKRRRMSRIVRRVRRVSWRGRRVSR
jgi:hypothetical protein